MGRMLEDFFTPTEMKEGISTVARIGELVSEIQKLKDVVALNKADLLRQCSTAANKLAITENKQCLQHFVQLDGVGFLTKWLQDAQNCSKDISGVAEDLIHAILTALDSLPDSVRAASCGVLPALQNLLVHANTKISQKARLLCQKWSSIQKGCTDNQDMDTEEARQTDQLKDSEASQDSENGEHDGANEAVIADDESNGNAILGDTSVSSVVSHGSSEKLPMTEEISATNDVGLATNGILRSDSLEAKSGAGQVAAPDMTTKAKSPEPNKPEHSCLPTKMHVEDQNDPASSDDMKKDEPSSADVSHSEKDTMEDLNHLANVSLIMHDSSDEERFGKEEAPTSSSDSDAEDAINEYRIRRCMDSFGDSSKAADTKSTALNGDKSTTLSEYDDDTDALEVARLVAIEVEREVIDYREPFCDSPDINSRDDSPDLVANLQPEPPIDESNDNKSSTTGNGSGSSSSLKEDGSGITDDTGPFTRKHARSTELEDFDLNENQCPEETDWHTKSILSNSINLSTPIAVAASRASSVFPARLHFEGEHGWKGSAATSAFRPASPRRNLEGDKSILASSQKASNMFDLNLADSDNAIADEPLSAAIFPTSGLASKDKSAALAVNWGFELDLNSPCDNEEAAITKTDVRSFWNPEQFAGTVSQPPSSSSRQPAVNNFDLNDNMSHMYGSSRAVNEFSAKASGKETSGNSEVTILGKRIVVGQQEHRPQIQHIFLGPSMESRLDARRPMQSYAHAPPSVDSYPYLSALSFPGPMMSLGGGPYMVDSRGPPVMPPFLGSGAGVSHPSFSSSRAIRPSSTELSYFHPSMGFSYGPSSEGPRREEGTYWPVPFQGQNMFVDERMRNMSQGGGSTSSGVAPKRREPDSGWDLFQGQNMFVDERMRNMSQGGGSTSSGVAPKRKEPDSGWDLFSRR